MTFFRFSSHGDDSLMLLVYEPYTTLTKLQDTPPSNHKRHLYLIMSININKKCIRGTFKETNLHMSLAEEVLFICFGKSNIYWNIYVYYIYYVKIYMYTYIDIFFLPNAGKISLCKGTWRECQFTPLENAVSYSWAQLMHLNPV